MKFGSKGSTWNPSHLSPLRTLTLSCTCCTFFVGVLWFANWVWLWSMQKLLEANGYGIWLCGNMPRIQHTKLATDTTHTQPWEKRKGINDVLHHLYSKPRSFHELRTHVCVSNKATIGTKLCQNAFQMIPFVSLVDAKKRRIFGTTIFSCFANVALIWTSYGETDVKFILCNKFCFR